MPELPRSVPYVVIGAGMHGLSTAFHLAKELRSRGLGSGEDIVVLEKSEPGAGASGIACGVVRNNYFQPAMSELMQACVEVRAGDLAQVEAVGDPVPEFEEAGAEPVAPRGGHVVDVARACERGEEP